MMQQSARVPRTECRLPSGGSRRRAAVAMAMLIVMLLSGLLIIGMVVGGARDQDLSVRRLNAIRAFYAAEAGMNMAIREVKEDYDEDGDGIIGSISDDNNTANDPTFGTAAVYVTQSLSGETVIAVSWGRAGLAKRKLEARLE